jgi:hypothetical protein
MSLDNNLNTSRLCFPPRGVIPKRPFVRVVIPATRASVCLRRYLLFPLATWDGHNFGRCQGSGRPAR